MRRMLVWWAACIGYTEIAGCMLQIGASELLEPATVRQWPSPQLPNMQHGTRLVPRGKEWYGLRRGVWVE